VAAGVLFAGSPERIPAGVTLAGVPLSGLTAEQAEAKLRARAAEVASTPVVFTAGGRRWALTPRQLEIRVDWAAAVQEALDVGQGPLPLRGLKRVKVRLFGEDLQPHADYFEAGLQYRVNDMATEIEHPAREAAIVLHGLSPVVTSAEAGRELVREEATSLIVRCGEPCPRPFDFISAAHSSRSDPHSSPRCSTCRGTGACSFG
jgi:hypothetical protein